MTGEELHDAALKAIQARKYDLLDHGPWAEGRSRGRPSALSQFVKDYPNAPLKQEQPAA
ncbi:MAG: hypothetical protein M3N29_09405 [Chloroflexota bacterium]|nr:hypothetical protein [Chloroflexota bacterium]